MHDFELLKKCLLESGVKKGDIIYMASDITLCLTQARKNGIKSQMQIDSYLNEFINVLQDIVGVEGTLLFPVFTWKFCRERFFDARTSLGEVGSLNNWILKKRSDFVRTKHPLYSFMVWGKEADYLSSIANVDAWGEDSIFAHLHHNHGKMVLFNVSLQRGFTFVHYVEECIRVPYRYNKSFSGLYVDMEGKESKRTCTMYVRDLDIISKGILLDDFFYAANIMECRMWNGCEIKVVNDFSDAYNLIREDFLHNRGRNCYSFDNYELDWSKGATHDDDFSNGLP